MHVYSGHVRSQFFTYDASAQGLELTVGALGYVGALAELYSRIENLAHEFYEPPFEIVFVCRILVHALLVYGEMSQRLSRRKTAHRVQYGGNLSLAVYHVAISLCVCKELEHAVLVAVGEQRGHIGRADVVLAGFEIDKAKMPGVYTVYAVYRHIEIHIETVGKMPHSVYGIFTAYKGKVLRVPAIEVSFLLEIVSCHRGHQTAVYVGVDRHIHCIWVGILAVPLPYHHSVRRFFNELVRGVEPAVDERPVYNAAFVRLVQTLDCVVYRRAKLRGRHIVHKVVAAAHIAHILEIELHRAALVVFSADAERRWLPPAR